MGSAINSAWQRFEPWLPEAKRGFARAKPRVDIAKTRLSKPGLLACGMAFTGLSRDYSVASPWQSHSLPHRAAVRVDSVRTAAKLR